LSNTQLHPNKNWFQHKRKVSRVKPFKKDIHSR